MQIVATARPVDAVCALPPMRIQRAPQHKYFFGVALTSNLQRAGVDDVGGRAAQVAQHVVEGGAEIQLVVVVLDIADVRRADAVFHSQQRVALQDGLGLEHIHGGHARACCAC